MIKFVRWSCFGIFDRQGDFVVSNRMRIHTGELVYCEALHKDDEFVITSEGFSIWITRSNLFDDSTKD